MAKKPSFEQSMTQLEQLVERLEQGELPLEEALAAFEEGVRLAGSCRAALQQVELKVDKLSRGSGQGLQSEPLTTEVDDDHA